MRHSSLLDHLGAFSARNQVHISAELYRVCELLSAEKEVEAHTLFVQNKHLGIETEFWKLFEGLSRYAENLINPLDEIALRYGTDKDSRFHNYTKYYFRYFFPRRLEVKRVLEIGVLGGASMRMWSEFFPSAKITGIDNDPKSFTADTERLKTYLGSQTDRDFLKFVLSDSGGNFDIIIDDGGHRMDEQLISFQELFPALAPRGIYVVEDLHSSYYDFCGGGYKKPGTMVEFLKDLIDHVNLFGKVDCADVPTALRAIKNKYPDQNFSLFEQRLREIHMFKSIAFLCTE